MCQTLDPHLPQHSAVNSERTQSHGETALSDSYVSTTKCALNDGRVCNGDFSHLSRSSLRSDGAGAGCEAQATRYHGQRAAVHSILPLLRELSSMTVVLRRWGCLRNSHSEASRAPVILAGDRMRWLVRHAQIARRDCSSSLKIGVFGRQLSQYRWQT